VSEPNAILANRYATSGHKKIDGWLEQIAVDAIVKISRRQQAIGIHGAACEIGVHHGRLFILLHLLTSPDERSVAYDLFDSQEQNVDGSGRGNRDMLQDNLQAAGCDVSRIGIHAANSLDLTPDLIRGAAQGGVRLFSVDGGHTPEITYSDLDLASQTLCEGGVIILDDFFNESWPGVAEGACKFFLENPERIFPVAIVGNKFIFTTDVTAARAYIQELKAGAAPVFKHMSAFFGQAVLVMTPETRSGFMRSLSQSWLWCTLRDTRLGRSLKQNVINRLRA
jgi:hypothetical protein